METRSCQNCKQDFTIEPDDFSFYEKMGAPAPTWCFSCRLMRKMMWRNERIWYRRTCPATGKNILSIFDPKKPYVVYDQEYWKSDAWDPMEFGREYDFSQPFFEQFSDLLKAVPQPNLIQKNVVNSEYSNNSLNIKNCYMVIATDGAEDSAYMNGLIRRVKNSFDLYHCNDDEYCYECVDCEKSSRIFFSEDCVSCLDSFLLYDCRNCMNCFGCVSLRNKQYCIFNEQYSKEEYAKELEKINTGSFISIVESKKRFEQLKMIVPKKFGLVLNSQNVSGDNIINSRNCLSCFTAKNDIENSKYSYCLLDKVKDVYDSYIVWNKSELIYETLSGTGNNIKFSGFIWGGFNIEYSYNCSECNNIFGCTGLRKKSYCILNKQYTEKEYKELVLKIKESMNIISYKDAKGRVYGYGEFFPPNISPFAYNETPAQEYFTKNKEEVLSQGFSWRDSDEKNYQITIKTQDLPDDIKNVDDSITSEIIECAHSGKCNDQCSTAFRIIQNELVFLRRFGLPIPRLCFGCRHMERIRQKNPLKLWHRQCMCEKEGHRHEGSCQNKFETSYATDRPEKVYCESCYQKEVL